MVLVDQSHKMTSQMYQMMSQVSPSGGKHSSEISETFEALRLLSTKRMVHHDRIFTIELVYPNP